MDDRVHSKVSPHERALFEAEDGYHSPTNDEPGPENEVTYDATGDVLVVRVGVPDGVSTEMMGWLSQEILVNMPIDIDGTGISILVANPREVFERQGATKRLLERLFGPSLYAMSSGVVRQSRVEPGGDVRGVPEVSAEELSAFSEVFAQLRGALMMRDDDPSYQLEILSEFPRNPLFSQRGRGIMEHGTLWVKGDPLPDDAYGDPEVGGFIQGPDGTRYGFKPVTPLDLPMDVPDTLDSDPGGLTAG